MIIFLLFILLSFYPHSATSVANLRHFETLTHVAVTSSIKRSADGSRHLAKHVMFRAFERDFDLTLKSGTHLMAKDFRARLVHEDGSSTMLTMDESLIYSGHLTDKPHVKVNAHIEDTLWSFQIFDHGDIYAVEAIELVSIPSLQYLLKEMKHTFIYGQQYSIRNSDPAWRLLTPSENPRNDTLIAYRASDMTSDSFNSSQFCGVPDHKTEVPQGNGTQSHDHAHIPHHYSHPSQDSRTDSRGRKKRGILPGATCSLFLVGDYTFFKGRCKGNHKACLALMFAYTQLADSIFRASAFEDKKSQTFIDVGLEIGEISLYSSYSQPIDRLPKHFNENREWTVAEKLNAFAIFVSIVTHRKSVCTSHLFTDYPFEKRVLGLAWMMTVCLETTPGHLKKSSGVTSGTESAEGAIPSLQMNLVYVHELGKYLLCICRGLSLGNDCSLGTTAGMHVLEEQLECQKHDNIQHYILDCKKSRLQRTGHNFGSEHDDTKAGCSFPENMGGNFIMWFRSVNGKSPNNLKFSPCSLKLIGAYIVHLHCFTPRSTVLTFCGNGIVDGKEQCDAGAFGVIDTDPCCTNDCKFRGQATCSDLNQACCRNCSMSPNGILCKTKDFIECEDASYCTGKSYECPDSAYLEDWTSCKDRGKCFRGICRGFCETISLKQGLNLKGCQCQTDENGAACKWCCYDLTDKDHPGPCVVHTNETVHDGRPCYKGYCKKGICESHSVSTVLRIYSYLPNFSPSKLGIFFKSNIVACVILVSLVVWLPLAIYFFIKDKKELALNPPLAIMYETEVHKHRTSEYRAKRQKKKRKREMKEAARNKAERSSFVLEVKEEVTPAKHKEKTPNKQFTWDQPQQNIPLQLPQ